MTAESLVVVSANLSRSPIQVSSQMYFLKSSYELMSPVETISKVVGCLPDQGSSHC